MVDKVEVEVVQASTQSWFRAILTGGTGNMALLADSLFKWATEIKSFDELNQVLGAAYAKAGNKKITKLTINGHGNATGFRIGEDWIELQTVPNFRRQFDAMRVVLDPNCPIFISACEAGRNSPLMQLISSILDRRSIISYVDEQAGGCPERGKSMVSDPTSSSSPPALAGGFSSGANTPPPSR